MQSTRRSLKPRSSRATDPSRHQVAAAARRAPVEALERRTLFAIATTPAGGEVPVNTYKASSQYHASTAMDADGDFVIAWESGGQDGSSYGIYAQRYDAAGVPQGGELHVSTATAGLQGSPAVAMDADGDFVVAWQSPQDGAGFGIYAQRYSATGAPQGGEFLVNGTTAGDQYSPAVAMDDAGSFVVAWSGPDSDGAGVFARRFTTAGVPRGAEFPVNTAKTGAQGEVAVATDADGDFVVVWQGGQGGTTNTIDVYAQRYDAAGTAQGAEFRVNTYQASQQDYPSVAMDADGDFTVVWASNRQDGSGYGVYAQRYDAAGAPQGSEFGVNTYKSGWQYFPDVAASASGDFLVTWQSEGQDPGNSYGVYGQRYTAAGATQGAEFRLNTYAPGRQANPSVAVDDSGDFVVAWDSAAQDGSFYGVYAQRYKEGGNEGAPALTSAVVGNGTEQRSQVKSFTLAFDRPVTLAPGAVKVELLNTGGSGRNDNSAPTSLNPWLLAPASPDGGKTLVFTFDQASPYVQKSSTGAPTGSLVDGIFKVSVDRAFVTAGGVPMTASPPPLTFHRLYGDIQGSKNVNNADYFGFRGSFGKPSTDPAYVAAFDFDGSGVVNNGDYFQFRNRFGKTFAY